MRSLLVPDLALLGAALTFFYALLLFDAPRRLFRDSDAGWHIRTGERIVDERSLPRTDPYSFSRPGAPWFAWEWGSDVLMGMAHRLGGLRGVALLYLAAIAACTWLWFRLHWALEGDFLLACAMASPMLSTVNMHWLARPHVLGWVLLLAWLLYAVRPHGRFSGRDAAVVAGLSLVWTNLHASFFLLPVMALLFAIAQWSRWFAAAALVASATTFINPYGWTLHWHVYQYLTSGELLAQVGEFQTFNFQAEGAAQIIVTVALAAVGATLAAIKKQWSGALVLALFFVLALRSARALPVLALLLPFANSAISATLRENKRLESLLRYSANLRRLEYGFRGYAWAPMVLLAGLLVLRGSASGFPADEFPVAAAAHLPEQARLFAPDKFGGYLIYHFRGERKVFFDGRSDFYGVPFMKRYVDMVQLRPGWLEEWNRWRFTHALLPVRYSLVDALPRLGWRETYRDSTAVLLAAPPALQEGTP